MLNHSRTEADRLLADAKAQADRMVAEARQHSERMVGRGPRGSRPHQRDGKARVRSQRRAREGRGRSPDRERQPLLREGRPGGHQGAAAPGVADRDRPGRERRGHPADRRGPCRGRPAARRMRHLRRQQARGVRGVPERHDCGRWAAAATSCAPPQVRTTTRRASHRGMRAGPAKYGRTIGVWRRTRNSRSPLVINIARLGRRPGSMMTVQETVPSPSRIGVELAAIDEGAPLELDLRIESVSEGVLVTGTVSAPTTGECARCLTPVTGHVEIDLTELFAYPDSATEATTEADEVGHVVDTTPSTSSSRSSTPSGWRCRSRRCAGRIAKGCARIAASRWRRPSRDTVTRRSTRAGRSSPRCWRPTTSDG